MIKISIIIPVYKVRDYIERCFDSILNQESEAFALECIFVNDCTPDDSMEIVIRKINNYMGKIDFIIINHDVNKGLSASRNTGVKSAKGDFVFFLDSDDWLETKSLDYLIEDYSVANYPWVDVIIGNTFVCENNKPAMNLKTDTYLLFDNKNEVALQKLLSRELFHTAWNKLVRRDFLLSHDITFEEGIIDEDLLWSYYVFLNAKGVLVKPRTTYVYEYNPNSIMHTTNKRLNQLLRSRIVISNRILDTPPNVYCPEYYTFLFFILARAVNLFEMNSDVLVSFSEDLKTAKDRLLRETLKHKYFLLYTYFHTLYKPCYYITHLKFYRRYFDRILRLLVSWEKHIF